MKNKSTHTWGRHKARERYAVGGLIPDTGSNVTEVANKPGPDTKYSVFNKNTGKTTYHATRLGATRSSDNQDNKYGAYITSVNPYPRLVDPRD